MLRTALVVVGVALVALCTAVNAHDIQLPAAIYDYAAGEWGVEVLSPCRSPAYGAVHFQNTTARIEWEEEGAADVVVSGESAEAALSLAALAAFMSKDGREYSYTTCEHQENYLATPQRPGGASPMTSTHMVMYTGVLSTAGAAKSCTDDLRRNVMVHALGAPAKATKGGQWRMQEALYMIEMVIDTKDLEATCAHTRSADVAEAVPDGRRRSRKHRGGRGFGAPGAASQADEALTESGTVTVRFIRRSAAAPSWAVRYYTPILFATIVIIYRVVHSFVATKTAKSGV